MGKRQKDWAKRARLQLIQELGGKCVYCGLWLIDDLEIDHIHGINWDRSRLDPSARVSRYKQEAKQGLLQVACKSCNSAYGARAARTARAESTLTNDNNPF